MGDEFDFVVAESAGQQGALGRTGGSRRRHHQGHDDVDLVTYSQRARRAVVLGRDRDQRGFTAVEHPFQGGHQHRDRGTRRDAKRAQDGYA